MFELHPTLSRRVASHVIENNPDTSSGHMQWLVAVLLHKYQHLCSVMDVVHVSLTQQPIRESIYECLRTQWQPWLKELAHEFEFTIQFATVAWNSSGELHNTCTKKVLGVGVTSIASLDTVWH